MRSKTAALNSDFSLDFYHFTSEMLQMLKNMYCAEKKSFWGDISSIILNQGDTFPSSGGDALAHRGHSTKWRPYAPQGTFDQMAPLRPRPPPRKQN